MPEIAAKTRAGWAGGRASDPLSRRQVLRQAGRLGVAALVTTTLSACAANPDRSPRTKAVPRVGVLWPTANEPSPLIDAFQRGLTELGHVDGQNVNLVWRFADGQEERLPELAKELAQLPVDVIVAGTTAPTQAAKEATTRIPIVMVAVGDPIGAGFVESFAKPGGNITGFTPNQLTLAGKQLELLKELVPGATRVAVFWHSGTSAHQVMLEVGQDTARWLGMELLPVSVNDPPGLEEQLQALAKEPPDALLVFGGAPTLSRRTRFVEFAATQRLPAVYGLKGFVEAGGLLSYGISLPAIYQGAAQYVDRILKGTWPADLPVQRPSRFEMAVNLKTARALNLRIPTELLLDATDVIQ